MRLFQLTLLLDQDGRRRTRPAAIKWMRPYCCATLAAVESPADQLEQTIVVDVTGCWWLDVDTPQARALAERYLADRLRSIG